MASFVAGSRVLRVGVPTLRPHALVVALADGAIRVHDLRALDSPATAIVSGVRGGASCAAVHTRLPLVAMGSATQRLRLYSVDGFELHELRNHR